MYRVIVCPDKYCRGVNIINGRPKTTRCSDCESQYKLSRYKISHRTDSKDEAVEARSRLLLKIRDDKREYEEIRDKGLIDNQESFANKNKKDTRSPKQIIRDAFSDAESERPQRDKIIQIAAESPKIDSEKANRYIEGMVRDGEILDYGQEIEKI